MSDEGHEPTAPTHFFQKILRSLTNTGTGMNFFSKIQTEFFSLLPKYILGKIHLHSRWIFGRAFVRSTTPTQKCISQAKVKIHFWWEGFSASAPLGAGWAGGWGQGLGPTPAKHKNPFLSKMDLPFGPCQGWPLDFDFEQKLSM
jgi:hypothetical protein